MGWGVILYIIYNQRAQWRKHWDNNNKDKDISPNVNNVNIQCFNVRIPERTRKAGEYWKKI